MPRSSHGRRGCGSRKGDLPAALRWLATRALGILGIDDEVTYDQHAEYPLLARIRITQKREALGTTETNNSPHDPMFE